MISVSIIVPVYNVEPYIKECLQSVMAQTYQGPMECILVDDCGSDRSMEIAENLVSSYHGPIVFRILHHDHNRGLSAARNTGMDAATGDYIYFFDSDDELTFDCIEKLVEPLREELYDLVVGNIQTIGNDNLHEYLKLKLKNGTVIRKSDIIKTYHKQWNMMAQNKLYRREFLRNEKITFKEGLIHEDELWSFLVSNLAQSLKAITFYTYKYYIRTNSITSKSTKETKRDAWVVIVTEMCNFLINRKIFSSSSYQIVQDFFYTVLLNSLKDYETFCRLYMTLRPLVQFSFGKRMVANGLNFKHQTRDLHYLLPIGFGMKFEYWQYRKRKE